MDDRYGDGGCCGAIYIYIYIHMVVGPNYDRRGGRSENVATEALCHSKGGHKRSSPNYFCAHINNEKRDIIPIFIVAFQISA